MGTLRSPDRDSRHPRTFKDDDSNSPPSCGGSCASGGSCGGLYILRQNLSIPQITCQYFIELPGTPRRLDLLDTNGDGEADRVFVACNCGGLQVVNVFPTSPPTLGATYTLFPDWVMDVKVAASGTRYFAYAAVYAAGLYVLEFFSNPATVPCLRAIRETNGELNGIALRQFGTNRYILGSDNRNSFFIWDFLDD